MAYCNETVNSNWYVSFGDLLTLLLCFFLIISVNTLAKPKKNETPKEFIAFSVKDNLIFKMPKAYKDLIKIKGLDSNLLSQDESGNYFLEFNAEKLKGNEEKIKMISTIEVPDGYGKKIIHFRSFKNFSEYNEVKQCFKDENLDVSSFKFTTDKKNIIKIMIYEK